jgi:2-keto-4-pentenoate hydratase/2-oxohepta-3-ene-1,7-dioic acid hydratase in catechol pathway
MKVVALVGGVGRLDPDGTVAQLDVACPSLTAFLRAGHPLADLATAGIVRRMPLAEAPVAPAAGAGSTVWGVGLNYRSKQLATGRDVPDHPVLFVKSAGSIAAVGAPITLPQASSCVDYEGEIAVLIGAPLFAAAPDEAGRAVIGFTAANDVTARDVMRWSGNPTLAKSFPNFGQIGPVVDVDGDGLAGTVTIDVDVNGERRQKDSSDGMLIGIAELVAVLSTYTPLWPGDLVLTGTPAGTGDETQRFLGDGDVVSVSVGELPPLVSVIGHPP